MGEQVAPLWCVDALRPRVSRNASAELALGACNGESKPGQLLVLNTDRIVHDICVSIVRLPLGMSDAAHMAVIALQDRWSGRCRQPPGEQSERE